MSHNFFNKHILFVMISTLILSVDLYAKPISDSGYESNEVLAVKNINMADRFLVESILTEIFGPETKKHVKKLVFNRPFIFGGPCDLYEQIRIEPHDDKAYDPETLCPGGRESFSAPISVPNNLLRVAHMHKVCGYLVSDKKTLDFSLNKIFEGNKVTAPDEKTIIKAFNLFYPQVEPSKEIVETLKKVGANTIKNHQKRWSLILRSLCTDPSWHFI